MLLKSLFNVSPYSKNHLNTLLNIESISTKITRNKFNLLTRLLHGENTAAPILKMCQLNERGNFLADIHNIAQTRNINLVEVLVTRQCPLIINDYDEIDEVTHNTLLHCLNNWNEGYSRKRFIEIMEERVVR